MRIPVGCEVWIDGAKIADGSGVETRAPVALDSLTVRWGRSTSVDQPDPATATLSLLDRGAGSARVDTLVALGSLLIVYAVYGTDRRVAFVGRVTDLDLTYDAGADGSVMDIVAADLLADLANRYVGAEPWPAESLAARAGRVGAAITTGGPGVVTVDPRPGALLVSRMDVDRQSAADLYRELATSGTGVLWVVVPTGTTTPTLRIEDTTARQSMWVFDQGPDNLWRPYPSSTAGVPLSSCAILRDPVKWARSTADLITRATVRWLDQSTSPDTTERSVGIVDADAETRYGARGLSVGTILTTESDATAAAQLLMAGAQATEAWRASGLTWDLDRSVSDDADTRALALDLLDNSARYGRLIRIESLPWWTPASSGEIGQYIEGGTYRFAGGRWVLALAGASGMGAGGSMSFQGTPRVIRYLDVAPEVSYLDLIGVTASVPEPTTRTNRAINPRVSSAGGGWTANRGWGTGGAGTYTYITSGTPPETGVGSVRRKQWTAAATSIGSNGFEVRATADNHFAVTAGETLTVTAYMRFIGAQPASKRSFVLRANFWNQVAASGAVAVGGTPVGETVSATALNAWYRLSATFVVPAGAAGMRVYIDTANVAGDAPMAAGDGLDATCLLIEAVAAVAPYFDGSFANTANKSYAWTGEVNQSTSTEITTYSLAAAAGDGRGTAVAPASHNNVNGWPVPDSTDAYRDTALALRNLAAAITPALGNVNLQFVVPGMVNHDSNGEALIDLSASFRTITAVWASVSGPSGWDPVYYQWVQKSGEPAAGKVRLRALKYSAPNDSTVLANNSTMPNLIVWGVAR